MTPPIDLPRDLCNDPSVCGHKEWLVTNGIGGFASGTVAGFNTRRYHGLLVAALHPPLGRTLLVAKLEEEAVYAGRPYALSADRWAGGTTAPDGFVNLDRFYLDGTTPVWSFALGDALLEKRVWMQPGANTTYVRYDLIRSSGPVVLTLGVLVNYRDYHGTTHAGDWRMRIEPVEDGLRVEAYDGATPFFLRSSGAELAPDHVWYRDFHLDAEAYRGLDATEDHLLAGHFTATIAPGGSLTLVASTEDMPLLDGTEAYAERRAYEQTRLSEAGLDDEPLLIQHLVLAADQFIVARPTVDDPGGQTVIAGYPWFSDWGRDTMIALPGLTLATGRPAVAARILRTFARFVDRA